MLVAPGMASENRFVLVPQADSPGNDYLRVDPSSLEECERRCDEQSACKAFTYNQRHGVCFLKRSASRSTKFYAFAITGIKLSPPVESTNVGANHSAGSANASSSFLLFPQTDSSGNDYSRIDRSSYETCRNKCRADNECNAFTYNRAHSVCFLKRAANQRPTFYALAITGIRLPEQVQAAQPPTPEPEVATPSEEKAPSEAEMRDRLCADMEREVPLPNKRNEGRPVRVDCLSRDYAIEVDRTEKWYEALGQAVYYSHLTGREPGIILICYKSERLCLEHALRLEETLSHLKVRATLWRCPQTARNREADCLKREVGAVEQAQTPPPTKNSAHP